MILQEKYIKELRDKFHMSDAKPIDTLIGTNCKIDTDESSPKVNKTM